MAAKNSDKGKSVKAIVLVDSYAWHETFGDARSPVNEASKGDEITVSADEFERGSNTTPMGLAKKDSKEHRRFLAGPVPTEAAKLTELSDDELRAIASMRGTEDVDDLNRDELLGAVLASPGGNERPQQP
jgi:hypothetical protein